MVGTALEMAACYTAERLMPQGGLMGAVGAGNSPTNGSNLLFYIK
jgi:hypothetical protein